MSNSQLKIKSKLPDVGQSIFTEMTNHAKACNAINLAQGFPDFSTSTELFNLVTKYMYAGKNQYAPMSGLEDLKQAIREKFHNVYAEGLSDQFEIAITAGATQAIFTVLQALVHSGDEVIYFEPAYDAYVPGIILCGAQPIPVISKYPDFEIDWENLEKKINAKTKMIIINNPGNPSGKVWSKEDYNRLHELIKNRSICVLADEVYEHLIYDGNKHLSILQIPAFADRCIAVYSFGKTFHNTGWKIGYSILSKPLYNEFLKVHQFNVFSVHSPSQFAFAEYLQEENNYLNLAQFYEEKRDQFMNGLQGSRFKAIPTNATYFQLVDYSDISNEDDVTFAKRITKEHGVASIPLSSLYSIPIDQRVVRFCFAKKEETLKKATDQLCRI